MATPDSLIIPESFETERLIIRVPRAGDGPAVNEAILETFEDLQPWMPWAKERPSVAQSEENSRKAYSLFLAREDITLRLIHRDTGLFLGSSGLHPRDWNIPSFEVGYWCRKRFQRQGYITEAINGILNFGFEILGAKRIVSHCDSQNERSIRVAKRVGFHLEGELPQDCFRTEGTLRHSLIFALTDRDWFGHPGRATGGNKRGITA
jgi:RimJ/RimL family protein N-acetyltransferase